MSTDTETMSQMQAAIAAEDTETICNLLNAGTDVNQRDGAGFTLLQNAARSGKGEALYVLLEMGADPDLRAASTGYTALHCAVQAANAAVAKTLLDHQARADVPDDHAQTPLHIAADKGSVELLKLLIAATADIMPRDDKGQTPRDIANRRIDQSVGRVEENFFQAALFLQLQEEGRGIDVETQQRRTEKIASDMAQLRSYPQRFKFKL